MTFSARVLTIIACFMATTAWAGIAPVGKVVSLKGAGKITREGATLPLLVGTAIHAQDAIETQQGGIAQIQFNDLSNVTVGSQSQLIIDAFVYNPEAPKDDGSALRVGSGFFHFVSGKLAHDKVKIETPVSTIGIRGTALAGEVMQGGKTMVSLVKCCVDVKNESGITKLDREGTYSEVKSRRSKPSAADITPDWWAEKLVASLGKSRDELGLEKLETEEDAPQAASQAKPAAAKINPAHGPADRKSFPFLNR